MHPKQVRCGNQRLLRFSGRENGGAHPNTHSGPLASETASRDRTPGPSTRKSPHLQAFGEEAFLQQECPPKTPRGESAVASLRVENPKVAPGRGRGRGRGGAGPRTRPRSRALRRACQHFCSTVAKKYVSGVPLLGNIGQTQIKEHFTK